MILKKHIKARDAQPDKTKADWDDISAGQICQIESKWSDGHFDMCQKRTKKALPKNDIA
jgi:hypothetical protein